MHTLAKLQESYGPSSRCSEQSAPQAIEPQRPPSDRAREDPLEEDGRINRHGGRGYLPGELPSHFFEGKRHEPRAIRVKEIAWSVLPGVVVWQQNAEER